MKSFRHFLSVVLCSVCLFVSAQDYTPKYTIINNPDYPTTDVAVATYNALDYGVDNTGNTDCSKTLQALLDKLAGVGTVSDMRGNFANITGGVLYLPAGTYLVKNQLTIPVGVTLRGDWKKPSKNGPVEGTIIKAKPTLGNGTTNESKAMFTMQPCSQVSNLTIWYPDQDISNVKVYPPTFLYGQNGFWGNEYCNVNHVTLLNSYIGIKLNSTNGGGCPNIFDVYGTPLHEGIVIDNIADVGRFDWITFAPDYWANSGLDKAPSLESVKAWTKNNATGIIMRRNDWSYTCNYTADSYKVGFHAQPGVDGGKPNGHNYNFNFNNCATGIMLDGISYCGIMFTRVKTQYCDVAVQSNGGSDGPAQFYECHLQGGYYALGIDAEAGTTMMLQDCKVSGRTLQLSGQLISNSCEYKGDVTIGSAARTIFTGNTVSGSFTNNSIYECKVSQTASAHNKMPEYKTEWSLPRQTKPARMALYIVTDAEFGCHPVGILDAISSAPDCSAGIQHALDKAGMEGGGVVYLPPGHYRMNNRLTIPKGVELKGASDIAAIPHGHGAIFEVFADENNSDAEPFISMAENSGIRGVTFNYPSQTTAKSIKTYPYAIRGNKDVYIVNVSMRAAYYGVDLFTNKCDNHYVDYLSGHAFKNVIRIGGGSENGMVSNIQFNTIAYAYGYETKFGQWPNSANCNPDNIAYIQNMRDLGFMKIENCDGEILYNNFLYGCNKGMVFQKSLGTFGKAAGNVHSLGNAVDGAVNTFVFESLETDLDLINSQIVALNNNGLSAYFITTMAGMKDHTVNFFSSDLWGGGDYLAKLQGGTVNLYNTSFNQSGEASTFSISEGCRLNLMNGLLLNVRRLVNTQGTDEQRLAIESAVLDPKGATTSKMITWRDNLPVSWSMSNLSALFPRTGWKVSANNDVNGTGIARNAIDGNAGSRWDTSASQQNGQWFAVDFGSNMTLNTIILDAMNSAGDGPAGYKVEAQQNGASTWTTLKEGANGGAMLVIRFDDIVARKVRITQTGSKGNYWSIHELYVGRLDNMTLASDIKNIGCDYSECNSISGIYNLGGQYLGTSSEFSVLPSGVYVVDGKIIIK